VKGPPVNWGQAGPNSEGCDVGWLCVAKRVPGGVDRKVYPAPDFVAGVVWVDQAAPAPHHIPDYHGRMVRSAFVYFSASRLRILRTARGISATSVLPNPNTKPGRGASPT
jgi:hypothetical protein